MKKLKILHCKSKSVIYVKQPLKLKLGLHVHVRTNIGIVESARSIKIPNSPSLKSPTVPNKR
jgi:hypothetical protein